ncbi:810_t:CDS:2 [Scutellospora calospora]|uniref:810_t:CDS:1 n=1 Tax=Scutellospora calospora TaxID=85575 RepID=A0ACA9ME41_9GLOM|nr:810_t:CDS:2 [Scutellospora calospora]
MEEIPNKFHYYYFQADKELSRHPLLIKVEELTKIPKTYLVGGAVSLAFLLIFFNILGELLSDIVGWLYPAYASFQAIEGKTDKAQWLTYW